MSSAHARALADCARAHIPADYARAHIPADYARAHIPAYYARPTSLLRTPLHLAPMKYNLYLVLTAHYLLLTTLCLYLPPTPTTDYHHWLPTSSHLRPTYVPPTARLLPIHRLP